MSESIVRLLTRLREERGATAVEYALVAVAIAAVIVAVVYEIGRQTNGLFSTLNGAW